MIRTSAVIDVYAYECQMYANVRHHNHLRPFAMTSPIAVAFALDMAQIKFKASAFDAEQTAIES